MDKFSWSEPIYQARCQKHFHSGAGGSAHAEKLRLLIMCLSVCMVVPYMQKQSQNGPENHVTDNKKDGRAKEIEIGYIYRVSHIPCRPFYVT